ncbi:uncharacterized protein EI90DRAFT_2815448, partial [Cantharellus anzutake]|uniref:uncharacterized protein n=1 Tax=Cantharellus anzutake TaxID=1750568 RepID=UPI001907E5D4
EEEVDSRVYCICQTLYDDEKIMVACDKCDEWYHTECVQLSEQVVELVDKFYCPKC